MVAKHHDTDPAADSLIFHKNRHRPEAEILELQQISHRAATQVFSCEISTTSTGTGLEEVMPVKSKSYNNRAKYDTSMKTSQL